MNDSKEYFNWLNNTDTEETPLNIQFDEPKKELVDVVYSNKGMRILYGRSKPLEGRLGKRLKAKL